MTGGPNFHLRELADPMRGCAFFSSSKARQTTTSNAEDNRVGAEDGAVALGAQGDINVTTLDGGAFELGEDAFDFGDRIVSALSGATTQAQANAGSLAGKLADLALMANEDPSDKIRAQTGQLILAVVGLVLLTRIFR